MAGTTSGIQLQGGHCSGCNHGNADAPSRLNQLEDKESLLKDHLQQNDKVIGPLYQAVSMGVRSSSDLIKGECMEVVQLLEQWEQLVLKDGKLYEQYEDVKGEVRWHVTTIT